MLYFRNSVLRTKCFLALLFFIIQSFIFPLQGAAQTGNPYILSSSPVSRYVDPREDKVPGSSQLQGTKTVTITFSEPVKNTTTPSLTISNFQISYLRNRTQLPANSADLATGTSPAVVLSGSGAGPYTLTFTPRIPLAAWTRIRAVNVVDLAGNPLTPANGFPGIVIGALPMDVSGDGQVLGNDIQIWHGYKNGNLNPAPLTLVDYLDLTRDSLVLGNDINRGISLINGIESFRAWSNYSMGPFAMCGDGVQELGEECEDGNTIDGDGCTAQCRIQSCGQVWGKQVAIGSGSFYSSVQQLSDGSYLLAGNYWANDGQALLVKTDALGNTCTISNPTATLVQCTGPNQFIKSYGGTAGDRLMHARKTVDGGYLLVGTTYSYPAGSHLDIWLIKTDANGDTCNYLSSNGQCSDTGAGGVVRFAKTFGEPTDVENALSAQEVLNSQGQVTGYMVGGYSYTLGLGGWEAWLVTTDLNGNTCNYLAADGTCSGTGVFSRTFGRGAGSELIYAAQQTSDRGFVLGGHIDYDDMWLVKTDANGTLCALDFKGECSGTGANGVPIFAKRYGDYLGTGEQGRHVQQTADGGFIIVGLTNGYGALGFDGWVVKTDSLGQTCDYSGDGVCNGTGAGGAITFARVFGIASDEWFMSARQTPDKGYILSAPGDTFGPGWILKITETGNTCNFSANGNCSDPVSGVFSKKHASFFEYAVPTADGGYAAAGHLAGQSYFLKTDAKGNLPTECVP